MLFDLGGVLIELGENPFPPSWLKDDTHFKLSDWFKSESAQQFEKGLISAEDFAQAMKRDLSLSQSLDEIIQEFTQWPIGHFSGNHDLLNTLQENYTLAVLSNTNELHWPRVLNEFEIPKYSQHIYSSHILKMAKPSPDIYEYVLEDLNASPETVIFFDDNQDNIQSAINVGIQGHLVKGPEELRNKLEELGLLKL